MDEIKRIVDEFYSLIFDIFEGRKIEKELSRKYYKQLRKAVEKVIPKEYAKKLIYEKSVSDLIELYLYSRAKISKLIGHLEWEQKFLKKLLESDIDSIKKREIIQNRLSSNEPLRNRLLNSKDINKAIKEELTTLDKTISELKGKYEKLKTIEKDISKLRKKKQRLYTYREKKVGLYYKILAVYLLVLFVAAAIYYVGKNAYEWIVDLKRDIDELINTNSYEEEIEL